LQKVTLADDAEAWKSSRVASDAERAVFQRLFEDLLVQAYAKKFAEYAGERFQVAGSQANDDDSITVNSLINRPNGDVVRLDWRVVDAGGLKISDLIVEGVSLRTTYRSDVASVIQNNGGKVADLIDELRQKTGSQ
jgi:phospholipid transport system substrate-binding protein